MNQTYKATLSQYALPQFLPTWGGKGGVIWGDLEGCSLKTMMFEKYPSISPYTYCANNPMKFVDPTGKIKVRWFDEYETGPRNNAYNKYKSKNGIIDVFAHGNPKNLGILICGSITNNNPTECNDVIKFYQSLNAQGVLDGEENKDKTIIFHVCEADKDMKRKNFRGNEYTEPSFAKKVSKADIFKDYVIVATASDDDIGTNNNGDLIEQNYDSWNAYYNGQLIGTYAGHQSMEGRNPREDFKENIEKIKKGEQFQVINLE